LQANVLNPQDDCTIYELLDEATDWRCIRLESPTNGQVSFKALMKLIILGAGNIAIVTNQPANVRLFSAVAKEFLFHGSVDGIQA
jgi:hypothetical protein